MEERLFTVNVFLCMLLWHVPELTLRQRLHAIEARGGAACRYTLTVESANHFPATVSQTVTRCLWDSAMR